MVHLQSGFFLLLIHSQTPQILYTEKAAKLTLRGVKSAYFWFILVCWWFLFTQPLNIKIKRKIQLNVKNHVNFQSVSNDELWLENIFVHFCFHGFFLVRVALNTYDSFFQICKIQDVYHLAPFRKMLAPELQRLSIWTSFEFGFELLSYIPTSTQAKSWSVRDYLYNPYKNKH